MSEIKSPQFSQSDHSFAKMPHFAILDLLTTTLVLSVPKIL